MTLKQIQSLVRHEPITMLTCYDASFAAMMARSNIDALLVGDSLGMVFQGHATTLPVSLADMIYHTGCVARGAPNSFILSDLPFGSYQASPAQALESSAALMAAGAQMVKLEGGEAMLETVSFLAARGIPVCAHVGLTPQSVHALGGYRVQGKTIEDAERILNEALSLEQAGANMIVLEAIPAELASRISDLLAIPTIGIGAGPNCDGQVLVLYDMLGLYWGSPPSFVRNFVENGVTSIEMAIQAYAHDVKTRRFPAKEHAF
ncbi:MAG: 3-methyl-2-oxobutanoate hydroxymethyltransferase [Proteobacteria bacterium]|nr:3-methyl-2-oxobutanoate hydroxymethyltransferase [Pseudomonadota bacterium]MDE3207772.1 3-methyl-2-oxobutanoate hydroxymethyltransferase [Pseudomonadota bacterium]